MEHDGAFDMATRQKRGQLTDGGQCQSLHASATRTAAAYSLDRPLPLGQGLWGRWGVSGGEPVCSTLGLDDGGD